MPRVIRPKVSAESNEREPGDKKGTYDATTVRAKAALPLQSSQIVRREEMFIMDYGLAGANVEGGSGTGSGVSGGALGVLPLLQSAEPRCASALFGSSLSA